MSKTKLYIFALSVLLFLLPNFAFAQSSRRQPGGRMEYIVVDKDTFYLGNIREAKIYPKLPKQKGREWRKYYRLVHNFSKTYPYAIVAGVMLEEVDSTIEADHLDGSKREKYIKQKQSELFKVFEKPLRNLTISQGQLLMKLIDREAGKSSFHIIKDYRNGIAAGFWQGMAKLFGEDLKKHYDPEGEDAGVEDLVEKWDDGSFPYFYYSLFWEYPPEVVIPEKYL